MDCKEGARKVKKSVTVLFIIFVLTILIVYAGWDEISGAVKNITPAYIMPVLTIQVGTLLLIAFRWHYLLRKEGHLIGFGKTFAINMAASYVESVTPSVKFGGEAAKVYLLRKHTGESYSNIAGIMLAIKYLSLIPFLFFTALSLCFAWMRFEIPAPVIIAFPLLAVFFLVTAVIYHRAGISTNTGEKDNRTAKFSPQELLSVSEKECLSLILKKINKIITLIGKKIEKINAFVQRAAAQSRKIINLRERFVLIGISALIWAVYPFKVYLITRMMGIEANIFTITIITFTAYLAGLIPLLPGGLGLFEGSMVLMFTLSGFNAAEGLAVTLISRLVTYWFPLLIAAAATSYLAIWENENGKEKMPKMKTISPFFSVSQRCENLINRWQPLYNFYFKTFYRNKLKRELLMADLGTCASVLHIGCGPAPFTAIYLAEKGYRVTALDYNKEAVKKAQKEIAKRGLQDHISVICANGATVDCRKFDAIWISLNVAEKKQVIGNALSLIKPGAVLIYRNVPCWLAFRYNRITAEKEAPGRISNRHTFKLGAESVLIKNELCADYSDAKKIELNIPIMSGGY